MQERTRQHLYERVGSGTRPETRKGKWREGNRPLEENRDFPTLLLGRSILYGTLVSRTEKTFSQLGDY